MSDRVIGTTFLMFILLVASVATAQARESRLPPDFPDGPLGDAAHCIAQTTVEEFTATPSTFGGAATVTWETTLPSDCPVPQFRLNGQPVPPSGSRVVNPQVTSRLTLSAQLLGVRAPSMASTVVVAGDIVAYELTADNEVVRASDPAQSVAYDAALAESREIIHSLSEGNQEQLLGKAIEVHLIPGDDTYVALTDLPPYRNQASNTSQEGQRLIKCLRGVGGHLQGQRTIVMAVAEETLVNTSVRGAALPWAECQQPGTPPPLGFIFAHELGHVVRDFALTSAQEADLQEAYQAQLDSPGGGTWLGGWDQDHADYVSRNDGEYFAEGTAGYFDYPWSTQNAHEYSPEWIFHNDENLYDVLASVYGSRAVIIE